MPVITEEKLRKLEKDGVLDQLVIEEKDILTPSAREFLNKKRISYDRNREKKEEKEEKLEIQKKDDKKLAMEDQDILEECAKVEKELEGNGRILLRASGTENLIRLMVEASSDELTDKYCEQVAKIVREKFEVK